MKRKLALTLPLTLLAGLTLAAPAPAGTANEKSHLAKGVVLAPISPAPEVVATEAPAGAPPIWMDNFDSYPTNSPLHGVGGWKGWDNDPTFGASTSDLQALSAPNSVDILAASDLVHEYVGYDTGRWKYTGFVYVPSVATGQPYFILLNTYVDGGPNNWSTQVCFDIGNGMVRDDPAADCTSGASLPILFDTWVELRVDIDLQANTQAFFYGADLLYADTWTEHVSGGGVANIAAVDLFANGSTSLFYDDLKLSNELFEDGFESGDTSAWSSTVP